MKAYHLIKQAVGIRPTPVDIPLPQPGPEQIRVRLEAASLNYRDLIYLNDGAGGEGRIPLSDGVGRIDAVGAGVDRWSVGDQVAASFFPDWEDGPFESRYHASALGGSTADGVLAEAIVLPAHAVVAIPAHLSALEAATLPCAAVTAWQALAARGGLAASDTVLIQGTGGVAIFALQIAVAIGARTIVTSSSDEKLERAARLGATHGINYARVPDWDRAVLELTEGRGATHVLELGGPGTFGRSLKSVAPSGRIAQIGVLTGFGPQENLLRLQSINATIDGICVGSRSHFEALNGFLVEHGIRPVIDRCYSFEDAPAAFDYLKSAQHFGKVSIEF